ncbi:phage holin family protein [Snodgrassella sp. CFCC 13594]|uniref:phage holin family protein n=1 Tax=Snodgrassella sp. CFCC 13594 TaxID=1775559 RepID=UPI00083356F1|nr:phage holin family protein [Snodgrassella sp. CFCC 13594]
MGLGDHARQFKSWLTYGSELLWLRLRMLRLDAIAQLRSVIFLFVAALFSTVAFFLGFISLLFALNSVLSPVAKMWVFFGLTGLFFLVVIGLLWWVARLWQQQGRFMEDTLHAMEQDFAYLNNRDTSIGKKNDE